jgi:hypothetical protein
VVMLSTCSQEETALNFDCDIGNPEGGGTFLSLSRSMPVQYLQIGHNCPLPNPYLISSDVT